VIVAAIDIGTQYSSCALSFKNSPTKISMKLLSTRNHAEHLGKVPTCILVNPNQVFDSFGQDAVDKYDDLASKGQNSGWMMFKQFLNTEVFII